MLVMFVVGMGNLGWMFVLAALMAAEKNLPLGRRLAAPVGIGLLAWAGATVVGHAPGQSDRASRFGLAPLLNTHGGRQRDLDRRGIGFCTAAP